MRIFLFLSMFLSCNLYARDLSHFSIDAGSFDQPLNDRHTKVHFIVTDSSGRKTGFKSFFTTDRGTLLVNEYREIPNSSYGVDQIGSLDPSVVPDEPESAALDFFRPVLKDIYTVQFIGIDDCKYFFQIKFKDSESKYLMSFPSNTYYNYITKGATQQYVLPIDPTPGAPAPIMTKIVTFDTLRQDLQVAQKLNQIGDEKFVGSLTRMVNISEKLAAKCKDEEGNKKGDDKKEDKCGNRKAAIRILKAFVKRLEVVNKKCAGTGETGEECEGNGEWQKDISEFKEEASKDSADKDEERKGNDRKEKKFITDEALKIVREDAQWLIKSLGGEIDRDHD